MRIENYVFIVFDTGSFESARDIRRIKGVLSQLRSFREECWGFP